MIRKIPNIEAWICTYFDYRDILLKITNPRLWSAFNLPLFELTLKHRDNNIYGDNELILCADWSLNGKKFTEEERDEINKTWNKFYEESTRK